MAENYRIVRPRLWDETGFRALSKMQASAQGLYLHLLTCRQAERIPGVVRSGRAALAERLKWDTADFDSCWDELEAAGFAKADWDSELIWLPGCMFDRSPENPNQVTGWRDAWDNIPDCPLKNEMWSEIDAYLGTRGTKKDFEYETNFQEAFRGACRKPQEDDDYRF